MKALISNTPMWLMASLTLGLAPFNPPHIYDKLQWIWNGGAFSGASPMQAADWFDLLLHGTPWVLLIVSLVYKLKQRKKTT